MNREPKKTLWAAAMALPLLCSCGEMLDVPETVKPEAMTLDRHTLIVMAQDHIQVNALFDPAGLSNASVWWTTADEQTATVRGGMVTGVSMGTTMLYAKSVLSQLADSCLVVVIDDWSHARFEHFRYDMAVYARVALAGGGPLPGDALVAAFCGDEVRGIGVQRSHGGHGYVELRVYSNQPQGEQIRFVVYQRGQGSAECRETLTFDEEAHGTLSSPVQLTVP